MPLSLVQVAGASDTQFKNAYEEDYSTAQQKAVHLHRIMYQFSGTNEVIGTITYPVLNMSTLARGGYTKLADFLLRSLKEAGIRPDTPFHKNEEGKYPAANGDDYRYMEYNTIGGGMRLVVDFKLGVIFLSAHYTDPVAIRADGGTGYGGAIDTLLTHMRLTRMLMQSHANGDTFNAMNEPGISEAERARRCEKYTGWKQRSPAFTAWLHNKNAAQDKQTILDWYSELI
jgi:hypothetical protein